MAVKTWSAGEVLTAVDLNDTISSKQDDVLTTKGDLATYGTAVSSLGVGSNGQVLTADSTQSLGIKWATPSSGLTHISTANFSSVSSVAIDGVFSSAPSIYLLIINTQGTVAGTTYLAYNMRSSGTPLNSAGAYEINGIINSNTAGPIRDYQGLTYGVFGNIGNVAGQCAVWLTLPASSNYPITFSQMHGTGSSATYSGLYNTRVSVAGSYDGIQFQPASGTMSGTYRLYSLTNS